MASVGLASGIKGRTDKVGVGRFVTLKPAVFFDRDGVLNFAVVRDGHPYPPASAAEVQLDPDAAASLRMLRTRGFAIIVVTNQPDVARGKTTRSTVEEINAFVQSQLDIDEIYTCFHDTSDDCACRKPRPGLLHAAAQEHGIDLEASYLVGDRWSDIAAGRSARCRTIWLERDYNERQPDSPDARCTSLALACNWILNDNNS